LHVPASPITRRTYAHTIRRVWATASLQLVIPDTGIIVSDEMNKARMTIIGMRNAVKFTIIMMRAALLRCHNAYVRTRNINSAQKMMVAAAKSSNPE